MIVEEEVFVEEPIGTNDTSIREIATSPKESNNEVGGDGVVVLAQNESLDAKTSYEESFEDEDEEDISQSLDESVPDDVSESDISDEVGSVASFDESGSENGGDEDMSWLRS